MKSLKIAGISALVAFFVGVPAYLIYLAQKEPVLLSKESVGKIVDVKGIGKRSSTSLEVRTTQGVFILNSTPPVKIGEEAFLHTWDKSDYRKYSLSWTGSSASYYLD